MSLYTEYKCKQCKFTFLAGYGVGTISRRQIFEFRSICKNCLSCFPIYSEDFGYPQPQKSCFLHSDSLTDSSQEQNKSNQLLWKRRIKRAKGSERKKLRQEQAKQEEQEALEHMLLQVKSGFTVSVKLENDDIYLDLTQAPCPNCDCLGDITLHFPQNAICPRCKLGTLDCQL